MQTGMVQPSGPSSHFWISLGSTWARYTVWGGAVNRLATITCVSPSVVNVSLLIVLLLFSSSDLPSLRVLRPTGRSFSPVLFAAWRATGPWLQRRPSPDAADALCHRRGGRPAPHLRALSDVEKSPAASSRTARPVPSRSLHPWPDVRGWRDGLGRPKRKTQRGGLRRHP